MRKIYWVFLINYWSMKFNYSLKSHYKNPWEFRKNNLKKRNEKSWEKGISFMEKDKKINDIIKKAFKHKIKKSNLHPSKINEINENIRSLRNLLKESILNYFHVNTKAKDEDTHYIPFQNKPKDLKFFTNIILLIDNLSLLRWNSEGFLDFLFNLENFCHQYQEYFKWPNDNVLFLIRKIIFKKRCLEYVDFLDSYDKFKEYFLENFKWFNIINKIHWEEQNSEDYISYEDDKNDYFTYLKIDIFNFNDLPLKDFNMLNDYVKNQEEDYQIYKRKKPYMDFNSKI